MLQFAIFIMIIFASLAGLIFFKFFLRDPERNAPAGDYILSPADGTIVSVKTQDAWAIIAIYMELTNVHVQWAPYEAKIISIDRLAGPSHLAFLPEASKNQQVVTTLDTRIGKILLKQIVGKLARRIETFFSPGDNIKRGQRFGRIILGSRVELWLPKDRVKILVCEKQKVKATETIAAEIIN